MLFEKSRAESARLNSKRCQSLTQVTVKSSRTPTPWDRFVRMSGNPLVPPLAEVLDQALTEQEKAEFAAHLRPLVEAGVGQDRMAVAYLKARDSEPASA